MGSYQDAVNSPTRPADINATAAFRYKYGFGLNLEQEIAKNVGVFSRLGWSDGQNQVWVFSDVDYTATAGGTGILAGRRQLELWLGKNSGNVL
jgi:high affinity Mn2+ porin